MLPRQSTDLALMSALTLAHSRLTQSEQKEQPLPEFVLKNLARARQAELDAFVARFDGMDSGDLVRWAHELQGDELSAALSGAIAKEWLKRTLGFVPKSAVYSLDLGAEHVVAGASRFIKRPIDFIYDVRLERPRISDGEVFETSCAATTNLVVHGARMERQTGKLLMVTARGNPSQFSFA